MEATIVVTTSLTTEAQLLGQFTALQVGEKQESISFTALDVAETIALVSELHRKTTLLQIFLANGSGEVPLSGEEIDKTPLKNEDIAGLHSRMNAATYRATMVTSRQDARFNVNGTFELANAASTTTSGAGTMLTDIFRSSFKQQTPQGTGSIFEINPDNPDTGENADVSERENILPNIHLYGTYRLMEDGLTIEMCFARGTVSREVFYRSEGYIVFASNSYWYTD